jgi:hypothetical protein
MQSAPYFMFSRAVARGAQGPPAAPVVTFMAGGKKLSS